MIKINPEIKYSQILTQYRKIHEFFSKKKIRGLKWMNSLWRANNVLLRVDCEDNSYVLKQVNDGGGTKEIKKLLALKDTYPSLIPEIFASESNAYVMGFQKGQHFFEMSAKERIEMSGLFGSIMSHELYVMNQAAYKKQDIQIIIQESFKEYLKKAAQYLKNGNLNFDFSIFSSVEAIPTHHDLNAANVIYSKKPKIIDPNEKGFDDVAKDIGRHVASIFFNDYDRFGNNMHQSLAVAEAFLSHFTDVNLLERTRYFIAQSFVSFLHYPTISVSKEKLKDMIVNTLRTTKPILLSLEDAVSDI